MVHWNCIDLLVALLNLLDEKVRHRITELLDSHRLDQALHKMITARSFPEWFSKEFTFDSLYGRLNGLRECLSTASRNGFLRLDGTNFHYHADLSEYVVNALLADIPFDPAEAKRLAQELSRLLAESLS